MTKEFTKDGKVIATLTDGTLTVAEGVSEIPVGIFDGNKEIRKAVIKIFGCKVRSYAFRGCDELESIEVSTMILEEHAFSGCPKLSSAYVHTMYGDPKNIFDNPEQVAKINYNNLPCYYYVYDAEAKQDYIEVR